MQRRRPLLDVLHDSSGGPAIEFALMGPILMTLLLGAVDVGRMFYVRQTLEYATEQAARYYTMNNASSQSTISTYLQCQMGGNKDPACTTPTGMGPAVVVTYSDVTTCNGNSGVTCTQIQAQYNFTFIAGYLGLSPKTLTARAQAVRYGS